MWLQYTRRHQNFAYCTFCSAAFSLPGALKIIQCHKCNSYCRYSFSYSSRQAAKTIPVAQSRLKNNNMIGTVFERHRQWSPRHKDPHETEFVANRTVFSSENVKWRSKQTKAAVSDLALLAISINAAQCCSVWRGVTIEKGRGTDWIPHH